MNYFKKIVLVCLSATGLYMYSSCIVCSETTTANKINPAGRLNIRVTKDDFSDFRESLILNVKNENVQLDNIFFSNINLNLASTTNLDVISSLREYPSHYPAPEHLIKPVIEDNTPNIYNISLSSQYNPPVAANKPNISNISITNKSYSNFSALQLIDKSKTAYKNKKYYESQIYLDNAVIKAGKNSWVLAEIAENYEKIHALSKADKTWEKAVTINPNRIELLYSYALYLCRNNKAGKANIYLNKIISINPQFMLAYYNLGNIHFKNKKYIDAIRAYYIAISINPYCEDAFYNLALSLEALNRKSLAIKYYKECLKLNPADIQVKNSLRRLKVLK